MLRCSGPRTADTADFEGLMGLKKYLLGEYLIPGRNDTTAGAECIAIARLGEVYVAVAELCFCSMMVMVATAGKIVRKCIAGGC